MPKVLIVEDDLHLRFVIRMVLEQASYDVSEAPDGMTAWERLGESLPDLILVDLKLPRLRGLELIDRIKTRPDTSSVPIVLLTGNRETATELRGSIPVVLKPFDKDSLLTTVNKALDRRSTTKSSLGPGA